MSMELAINHACFYECNTLNMLYTVCAIFKPKKQRFKHIIYICSVCVCVCGRTYACIACVFRKTESGRMSIMVLIFAVATKQFYETLL